MCGSTGLDATPTVLIHICHPVHRILGAGCITLRFILFSEHSGHLSLETLYHHQKIMTLSLCSQQHHAQNALTKDIIYTVT